MLTVVYLPVTHPTHCVYEMKRDCKGCSQVENWQVCTSFCDLVIQDLPRIVL